MEKSSNRWAVIGGGILGMTTAYRLAQHGHAVTLFERADHLGGLADSWQIGDIYWDRYYHVILLSDLRLRGLLKELRLENDMEWVETKTGFFTDGRLYSMSNTLEFLTFPPLALIDKLRLGFTIFYASKIRNTLPLQKITAVEWLERFSGRGAFEKIWKPLMKAKLGENYHLASAAFIQAVIARMSSARQSGLKKEMFGYLPGGYSRILGAFQEAIQESGVDIRLSSQVQEVVQDDSDRSFTLKTGNDSSDSFGKVIITVPGPYISDMCPLLTTNEKRKLNRVVYQGIVCVSLLLKESLSPYYITNITDEWVPFTAVIEMSAVVARHHLNGHSLVYLPRYITTGDPAHEQEDPDIIEEAISTLSKMYPHFSRQSVVDAKVARTRYLLPLPTLNYSEIMPEMKTSVEGLYIVNSSQIPDGTLNVNECVTLADKAVFKIRSDHD